MSDKILSYLNALEENNDRAWYHAHEAERRAASDDFGALVEALTLRIAAFDPAILPGDPKQLIFRLTRDTRFGADKSPYRPAMRCHIGPAGKLPIPVGYYLFLQPGGRSFLGGGLFADRFADATRMVRDAIAAQPQAFLDIARRTPPQGTALKKVPAPYSPDHPAANYFRYKCWYLEWTMNDAQLLDRRAFVGYAAAQFRRMKPLNDFLNAALKGVVMPQRG